MFVLKKRLIAIVALTIMSGCAATDVANRYYADERYAPVPVEQVAVLEKPPARPYTIIAEFQSRGEQPESVRKKAAGIGADAVIITLFGGEHSLKAEWASDERNMSKTFTRIVGVAIKMDEGS